MALYIAVCNNDVRVIFKDTDYLRLLAQVRAYFETYGHAFTIMQDEKDPIKFLSHLKAIDLENEKDRSRFGRASTDPLR